MNTKSELGNFTMKKVVRKERKMNLELRSADLKKKLS